MKHFIYLDTDIVSSIIAQAEKGYITQQTIENGNETTQTKGKTISASAEVSGSGGFWKFLQTEAKASLTGGFQNGNTSQSSTKELNEKILHDAAFDIAYRYITPFVVKHGDQDQDVEGNYLEIKRVFDFVDFDYLEGLFQKDGAIDYTKKAKAREIEENSEQLTSNYNREQQRRANSKIKSEIRNAIDASNKQYDNAASIIRAFRCLIPYSRILISYDGYLIPLDDKYFRINPSSLGFKYGGEMTCVGMVTNIIGESTDSADSKNVFATLHYAVNEILRSILPSTESDLCVIHPIAVYYGE